MQQLEISDFWQDAGDKPAGTGKGCKGKGKGKGKSGAKSNTESATSPGTYVCDFRFLDSFCKSFARQTTKLSKINALDFRPYMYMARYLSAS